jgi:hypothetical protein
MLIRVEFAFGGPQVGVVFELAVVFHFFFGVKDFAAINTHVLSSAGLWCASALCRLIQIQFTPLIRIEKVNVT